MVGGRHLPSVNELQSLINYEYAYPALPNGAGTTQWSEGDVFAGVQSYYYWSSTSYVGNASRAWYVDLYYGNVNIYPKLYTGYVWPVRVGQ